MVEMDNGPEHVDRIVSSVVEQLDPRKQVASALALDADGRLSVQGVADPIDVHGRLILIAVGKASIPMAAGAIDALGDRIDDALAITKAGLESPFDPPVSLKVLEADHPVPQHSSLAAGAAVRERVDDLNDDDVLLMLISGGGSALMEDLVEGVTLDDLQQATDHMLRAGATINELNAVRRRISRLKGGRLANLAAPAQVINLIVSDVLNSPLQDIASGPTVEPPEVDETFAAVMRRPDLIDGLPGSVRAVLDQESAERAEWSDNVIGTEILSDAEAAARIAIDAAVGLGYYVQTLGYDFQGEARELGRVIGTMSRHARRVPDAFQLPMALIGAGEMTVTVRGDGVGGRNTEMALAAAREIAGLPGITICSFATDGDDGLSACAGGTVTGSTIAELRDHGVDPEEALAHSDSATALRKASATIDIGPTGTNVNDIYLALIHPEE
jgi:glycerate 2-kinase